MKVLGISCSPRRNGNTEIIIQEALEGAKEVGAKTEFLPAGTMDIKPCTACEACQRTGECKIRDAMQEIYPKLLEANGIVFGTPVYFWAMAAQAKIFIDRTYALRYPTLKMANKVGGVITVAGREGAISAAMPIVLYFAMNHMLQTEPIDGLADRKGGIVHDERSMKAACEMGKQIALLAQQGFTYPKEYDIPYYDYVYKKYKVSGYPKRVE